MGEEVRLVPMSDVDVRALRAAASGLRVGLKRSALLDLLVDAWESGITEEEADRIEDWHGDFVWGTHDFDDVILRKLQAAFSNNQPKGEGDGSHAE